MGYLTQWTELGGELNGVSFLSAVVKSLSFTSDCSIRLPGWNCWFIWDDVDISHLHGALHIFILTR